MVKLGKIRIKKVVKEYRSGLDLIHEVEHTLFVGSKKLISQEADISLTDGLKALGIEHKTEFTLENN